MQNVNLNLIPGSVLPVVNVSQYDVGRHFTLTVYEGATAYSLTGKGVQIRGTKPDGNGFAYDSTDGAISVSNNVVTVSTLQQMTACGGQVMCELRITSGSDVLGTINFILDCEPSALSDDTPISDTDIPAIERDMQAAVDRAEDAADDAEAAAEHYPYIDDVSKHWMVWDVENNQWSDTGVVAEGTSGDYSQLTNKPQINGVTLSGNKTAADLSLASDAVMTGATAGTAGAKGLVPAPAAGDENKYLGGDGAWHTPGGGGASALDDLTDVVITTPTDGQVLTYDADNDIWINADGGSAGFNYKNWLSAANISPSGFADLAAVLADDETVRHLMTIHDAVDYLTGFVASDANISTILNDNYAAKWITLRDYAYDTLDYYFHSSMDTIGKYGYGEWGVVDDTTTPVTWGPLGNVPVMTSNTAPYGEVIYGSENSASYKAYFAFDNNDSTRWGAINGTLAESSVYIGYKFTNPVNVRRVGLKMFVNSDTLASGTFDVKGSNDGTNYTTIGSYTWTKDADMQYVDITNTGYYLYYRIVPTSYTFTTSSNVSGVTFVAIQFYGRTLKESVPVMTSNTAPWGEVSASYAYTGNDAYKAFNGIADTSGTRNLWSAYGSPTDYPYIQYDFGVKVCVKQVSYVNPYNGSQYYNKNVTILGSNDGNTFEELGAYVCTGGNSVKNSFDVNSSTGFRYVRMRVDAFYSNGSTITNHGVASQMQIYAENYSEYDWDATTPRHYLYDHGVKPNETITENGTVTDYDSYIEIGNGVAGANYDGILTGSAIDLSSYNLERIAYDKILSTNDTNNYATTWVADTNTLIYTQSTAYKHLRKDSVYIPYDEFFDISSINASQYIAIMYSGQNASRIFDFTINEWWLE